MQAWEAARQQKRDAKIAAAEAQHAALCTFKPALGARGGSAPPLQQRRSPALPPTRAASPPAAVVAAPPPPPEPAVRLPLALRSSRAAWGTALERAAAAAGGNVLEEARLVRGIVNIGAVRAHVPPPPPGPPPPGAQRVAQPRAGSGGGAPPPLAASPGRGARHASPPPPPLPPPPYDLPYEVQLARLRREHEAQVAALAEALEAARAAPGLAPQQLAALRELNALYMEADGERSRLLLSEAVAQHAFAEASRAWGEERAWLREECARAGAAARALSEDIAPLRAALGGAVRRADALSGELARREEELAALRARAAADAASAVAAAAAAAAAAGIVSVVSPAAGKRRGGRTPQALLLRDVAEGGGALAGGGGEEGVADALVSHADILEALALETKRCKAELAGAQLQVLERAGEAEGAALARDALAREVAGLQREAALLREKLDSEAALHDAALREHIERA
jgi:hypothetical protein